MDIKGILNQLKIEAHNPRPHLDLARAYLDAGDEAKSRDLVVTWHRRSGDDPQLWHGWAELAEKLGMARQARTCYENALRLAPHDWEAMYRLAVLLAEVGHYEKSLHYLRKIIRNQPTHQAARTLLAENYRALGLGGQAEALAPQPETTAPALPPRYFPPSISDTDITTFLRLFGGREIGYAVHQLAPDTGELAYVYKETPLGPDLVMRHLQGDLALAAYPLRSDNTSRYAAVSLRLPVRVWEANLRNQGYLIYLEEKMRHQVLVLARYARERNLPAYPEDRGAYQFRLWFFFDDFVHFLKIKELLTIFLANGPPRDKSFVVEPLLATKPVGIGWVERPVALPLGIHPGTRRRSLFLDADGQPYGEQLKLLRQIRPIPLPTALANLRAARRSGRVPFLQPEELPAPVAPLPQRCPVVAHLIQKARSGRVLRREEKVILFYTVGLADPDGQALHHLLEASPDYQYQKVARQLSRLPPHPISCIKIRQLVPELTASLACDCTFDLSGGKYPSPLLHLNPHLVPPRQEFEAPEKLPWREAARRYINLRQQAEEVNRALARLEALLEKHCVRQGTDQLVVEGVKLRRVERGDQIHWEMERL